MYAKRVPAMTASVRVIRGFMGQKGEIERGRGYGGVDY